MAVQNGAFTRSNGFGNEPGKNWPRFELQTYKDEAASAREGRPIYASREIVHVIMPGNPQTQPALLVDEELRNRWPQQYEAFKQGLEPSVDGIPLEAWPILNRAQILELKHFGFQTVEHIAEMSDLAIQKIGMGGRILKEKAQAYLDDAAASALTERLSAENAKQEVELSTLRNQVDTLSDLVQRLHAELQGMKNAPSPILTALPMASDPVEVAKGNGNLEGVSSSLDSFGSQARRKPGRPRKDAA